MLHATDHALCSLCEGRNNQKAYWWQGPESPFSEGAAQSHGVASGSPAGPSRPQTVVGCSGDGCSSPLFQAPVTSASVASPPSSAGWGSSSGNVNSGGSGCSGGCQYFWQRPGHPCSSHTGPGCPSGFGCVHYEWCSNGIVLRGGSGSSSSSPGRKPSRHEVRPLFFYVPKPDCFEISHRSSRDQ